MAMEVDRRTDGQDDKSVYREGRFSIALADQRAREALELVECPSGP